MPYICTTCGEEHTDLPHIGSAAPFHWADPLDHDHNSLLTEDLCIIEGRDYFSPTQSTFANGMHAVVVETDPDTAEIRILRYCVVHDCGTLINPRIVEGQIHGGVA